MPSKRAHVKTRHGCRQCKSRRVKCDLQRPRCGNCHRRREECDFMLEAQPWTPPATASSASSPPTIPTDKESPASMNLLDLELLHHYTTTIHYTLCLDPNVQKMWQIDVPKNALTHPYLMHCILATSALELFISGSPSGNDTYLNAAVRHHNAALSDYRLLLTTVTKENCDALSASSALLAVISAAMIFLPCNPEPKSPIEGIIEVSALMKGVHVMVAAGGQFVREGKLAPLLNRKPWDGLQQVPEDVVPALETLKSKVTSSYDHERASIYLESIEELHRSFQAVAVNPEHLPIFFVFLVLASREYFDFLKGNDSMALVILAHFGVVCQASSKLWWARDWDQIIIDGVDEALDDEWRQLIAWPKKKIKGRLRSSELAEHSNRAIVNP